LSLQHDTPANIETSKWKNPLLLYTMTRAKMQSTTWGEVHLTAVVAQALHDKHKPSLLLLLLLLPQALQIRKP